MPDETLFWKKYINSLFMLRICHQLVSFDMKDEKLKKIEKLLEFYFMSKIYPEFYIL